MLVSSLVGRPKHNTMGTQKSRHALSSWAGLDLSGAEGELVSVSLADLPSDGRGGGGGGLWLDFCSLCSFSYPCYGNGLVAEAVVSLKNLHAKVC